MTDFTPAHLAELRAVAEKLGVRGWAVDEDGDVVIADQDPDSLDWVATPWRPEHEAQYIAAFDPPTVLALIAALESVLEFTTSERDAIRTRYDMTGGIPADYRGYANACDDVIALIEDALEAANESKPPNSVTSESANERELAELRAALEAKTAEVESRIEDRDWFKARAERAERERDDLEERLSGMLCDLTGGKLSKTGYDVRTMTQAVEEHFNELEQSDRDEAWQAVVEARKERDEARGHIRALAKWVGVPEDTPLLDIAVEVSASLEMHLDVLRERDEARSEAQHAASVIEIVRCLVGGLGVPYHPDIHEAFDICDDFSNQWNSTSETPAESMRRERDEARAEVESITSQWRATGRAEADAHRRAEKAEAEVKRLEEVDKLLAEAEEANETYQGMEKELDELKTTLTELAQSAAIIPNEEVVIDGDVFTWGDLPDVLRRTRETLAEARREAKDLYIKRQATEAALERVKALHQPFEWSFGYGPVKSCKHCVGMGGDESKTEWPCPTIQAIKETP